MGILLFFPFKNSKIRSEREKTYVQVNIKQRIKRQMM